MARIDIPEPGPEIGTAADLLLEDLWEQGGQPDVRGFLARWPEMRLRDLLAVLRVDQRRRWLSGQRVGVAGYLREFPFLVADAEAVFELVYSELLIREDLNEQLDPREYAAEFPELADRLRIQLEVHKALSSDEFNELAWPPAHGVPSPPNPHVAGYEILDEIGRGGMGVVFRARQLKPARLVALKMILDGRFASERDLLRFQNEAEVIAALAHPNIVPILEFGQHEGLHYFSMPLFTGGSLAASQRNPSGSSRQAARLVADVAAAVHHAHERGILHRDLKPANILLDDQGRPHVTDFGLAKRVVDGRDLTETGAIMGSPGYMSPEQASGVPALVTIASDIYGLGAILYALLTGQAPVEAASAHEAMARLLEDPPDPPSKINSAVPRPLDQICLMCLEKDPDRRYPTAKALAADLERWLDGEPVLAQPEPLAERTLRWMRRRRTGVIAVASAMMAALVGLALVLAVQARANRELTAANERERTRFDLAMEAIKTFHTGVSEDLLLKQPHSQTLRAKLLHGAREFIGKLQTLLKDHTDRHSRRAMGQAYGELAALTDKIGSKIEALEMYRRALALLRELASEERANNDAHAEVGRCLLAQGTLQYEIGHAELAMVDYKEALAVLDRVSRSGDPDGNVRVDLARCKHQIGDLLAAIGRPEEAMTWFQSARSLRETLARTHPAVTKFRSSLAESDLAIGSLLWKGGHPTEGVASFERAKAMFEALARDHPSAAEFHRELAHCYNAIGYPLHAIGKTAEAIESFTAARSILETLVRETPSVTEFRQQLAYSDTQIGILLCDTRRPTEALGPYERARESLEALAQANPDVADIKNDLARCYSQMSQVLLTIGKPVEALASSEKARLLRELLVSTNPKVTEYRSDLASTLGLLAGLKRQEGHYNEATANYRRAIVVLEIIAARTPEDDYNLACYHSCLAGMASDARSAISAAEGRAESDRAVADLRRAAVAGFRMLSLMAFDHDLDPLRSRADFQLLMMDFSFPNDPFAR
jgi:eukaryotic-like serine/threonine-protein kinase